MKILVVDDSPIMRKLVLKALKKGGYSMDDVVQAADGTLALVEIENDMPDLVLADWNMPEMSGLELLQKVRDEQESSVPFIFITTEFTQAKHRIAQENGADYLLSKPFNATELKTAINSVMSIM